jgi:Tol biopolymer transport system component/TolA-binding protein
MKTGKTLTIIMAIGLVLGSYNSYAQTAEELLPKAIQLEEVKGDLDEALKTYQLILNKYPDNREVCAEAMLHLGICYEKLGLDQARQTYRDVISKYSEQPDKVAMARDRISRLDAYTSELIAKAEQHLKKGNELFKLWEYESAIKEYENAIKSGPNTQLALNARYCIGQSWYKAGKYDSALATFKKLIEENPKSNIAPVTELMVAQVKHAMENDKTQATINNSSDENTIIDTETGIKYTKIRSFSGKNDLISYTSGGFNLSPDGRFMVLENMVIPTDGSEAFELVDMKATRSIYSPDMKKAAFYADSAIWAVSVSTETGRSTGQPKKLVKGRYRYQNPVTWSPDGKKIAYQRVDAKTAGAVWAVSVADGSLYTVTDETGAYYFPAWSPDGKTIACWKNRKEVWLYPAEEGEPKKIIDVGGFPFWSPDGKWLYHSNWEFRKLYCLSDNRNFDLITPVEVGDIIGFSHDVKKMLFYRPSYETKWGFKVASSSGGPSFEPARDIDVYNINWSPDCKKVLAQGENPAGDIVYRIIPLGGGESYMLNIEVDVDGKVLPFDISPDEKKLAFTVTRDDGRKDLYIAPISVKDARTTGPAKLIIEGWSVVAFNVDFSWSDDGSKLALIHKNDILIVPLTGGEPAYITNSPEKKRWIRWSPNGEMLSYYTDYAEDKTSRTLTIISASGENSRKIFEDCVTAAWSPDSKRFSVYAGGKILIMSSDGSDVKQIFNEDDDNLTNLSSAIWSPDGKNLAFLGSNSETEESYLFMISLENEKITRLAPEDNSPDKYSLRWSPDGKWISYLTEEVKKVRFEGTMWEADFKEVIEKLAK